MQLHLNHPARMPGSNLEDVPGNLGRASTADPMVDDKAILWNSRSTSGSNMDDSTAAKFTLRKSQVSAEREYRKFRSIAAAAELTKMHKTCKSPATYCQQIEAVHNTGSLRLRCPSTDPRQYDRGMLQGMSNNRSLLSH